MFYSNSERHTSMRSPSNGSIAGSGSYSTLSFNNEGAFLCIAMSTIHPRSITSMPNEVLLRLFQLLAADGSVSSKGARARIGRVCKQWRNISRLNRSLWTVIIINIEEPEEDQDQDQDSLSSEESTLDVDHPDVSFLDQSLYLSHSLPLDISFTYKTYPPQHLRHRELISSALASLARFCIRWRTFKCTSPSSVIYDLGLLTLGLRGSNLLGSLSLMCNDGNPSLWDRDLVNALDIKPRSCLTHLEANFDISTIELENWSNVTSLTAGFATNTYCHYVLSCTTGLDTLFLIHLGHEQAEDPPQAREPTIVNSVRHLKLSPCAALGFLGQFRFPQVDQLSLDEPSDRFTSHKRSGECPNKSRSFDMETLCTTLQMPINPRRIRRLNIDWGIVPPNQSSTLSPLLRLVETSLTVLHIEFGRGILSHARSLFHSLVIADKTPLLPNLSELHLTETRDPPLYSRFFLMFHGNAFEDMILSRCDSSNVAGISVLRTLRLSSNSSADGPQSLVLSSLCLTLQGLSNMEVPEDERLDVEWVIGDADILQEGRSYAEMLY